MKRALILPADNGDTVTLDNKQSHHLVRVLRVQAGESLELLDGIGGRYRGRVEQLAPSVTVLIENLSREPESSGPRIDLYQGAITPSLMDQLVVQAGELGVRSFTALTTSRCQGRLSSKRGSQRLERWRRLSRASVKQSGRAHLMQISDPMTFSNMIRLPQRHPSLLPLVCAENNPRTALEAVTWSSFQTIAVAIGPEGGFSPDEFAAAEDAGWRLIGLGTATLRAETATVAILSILQHYLGNL